ncbi:MAG: peptidyl-prolyl cis-trans isomerase, partial [Rhodospirillaceae bacterium]|nr:peptidyl-prolyl cis-trans isomerase [Rhodospirillaceae bacterium]
SGDSNLGGELATKLFGLGKGGVVEGPALNGNGHSVVRLVSITRADPKSDEKTLKRLDQYVRSSMTDDIMAQYRAALRQKYNVEINDRIIDALFDELNVRG